MSDLAKPDRAPYGRCNCGWALPRVRMTYKGAVDVYEVPWHLELVCPHCGAAREGEGPPGKTDRREPSGVAATRRRVLPPKR